MNDEEGVAHLNPNDAQYSCMTLRYPLTRFCRILS